MSKDIKNIRNKLKCIVEVDFFEEKKKKQEREKRMERRRQKVQISEEGGRVVCLTCQ